MDDSLRISDHDEEEELQTTAEVLNKFEEMWQNEKFCPDLLPFEEELVHCIRDQISHMKKSLRGPDIGDIRKTIHQIELNRITYMLSSYLQIRLKKIEKFGAYIMEKESSNSVDAEAGSLMSPEERRYAIEYIALTEDFLKNNVVDHFPANLQNFHLSKAATKPNSDGYIFLRVKNNAGGVVIEEQAGNFTSEEIVDFVKGGQHIMRYKPVATLLKTGKIKLI